MRCVTISLRPLGHARPQLPVQCRERIPKLDKALSALIEDLHARGLDKDVSVVVWGEFGRTPKINKDAGRDHWPPVSFALLAGGGMRTGQVIGSTDRLRRDAKDRPSPSRTSSRRSITTSASAPTPPSPTAAAGRCTCSTSFEPIREVI